MAGKLGSFQPEHIGFLAFQPPGFLDCSSNPLSESDKNSLLDGTSMGKMGLCVKEKRFPTYGSSELSRIGKACEGCRGRDVDVFNIW